MFRGAQAAIVKGSGLSKSFVSLWLNGQRDINSYQTAERLSKTFVGTTPEDWVKRNWLKIEKGVVNWIRLNDPVAYSKMKVRSRIRKRKRPR